MKPKPFARLLERAAEVGVDTLGYTPENAERLKARVEEKERLISEEVDGARPLREDEGEEVTATATDVSTYVDRAMFEAEEIEDDALKAPKVYLLSATPDPLGACAAMMMMYEGRVIRDLAEITDDERRHYFDQTFKTTLDTPLEAIDFHFMVEGVTRAHTHQEVRQRTAVFAQESMRFAVKEQIAARPGPITGSNRATEAVWQGAVAAIWDAYKFLIANGVPAEEARGLLPHDTLTRLHHKVNLRSLKQELGKRTCTQAQFDWRLWAASVASAIRDYGAEGAVERYASPAGKNYVHTETYEGDAEPSKYVSSSNWQFQYIAASPIFTPICFQTGKCMFQASMDRGCTIRERVDRGAFDEIDVVEWAADPRAGWVR
jgi:flavin-dependent thymidylate synthase